MSQAVPILMYHRVADVPRSSPGWWLAVPRGEFVAQVEHLAGCGWRGVALRQLAGALAGGEPLPPRTFVLTFDDGARDVVEHALPVLAERGWGATLFVSSALVGGRGEFGEELASWETLRETAGAGFEIGSHGARHERLAGLGDARLEEEISGSRATIAERIGSAPESFAYPFGSFDARTMAAVERAGYTAAVSTELGTRHRPELRWRLRRVAVFPGLGGAALERRMGWLYDAWHRSRRWTGSGTWGRSGK